MKIIMKQNLLEMEVIQYHLLQIMMIQKQIYLIFQILKKIQNLKLLLQMKIIMNIMFYVDYGNQKLVNLEYFVI